MTWDDLYMFSFLWCDLTPMRTRENEKISSGVSAIGWEWEEKGERQVRIEEVLFARMEEMRSEEKEKMMMMILMMWNLEALDFWFSHSFPRGKCLWRKRSSESGRSSCIRWRWVEGRGLSSFPSSILNLNRVVSSLPSIPPSSPSVSHSSYFLTSSFPPLLMVYTSPSR